MDTSVQFQSYDQRAERERIEYPPPNAEELRHARDRAGRPSERGGVQDLLNELAIRAELADTSPLLIGCLATLFDQFGEQGVVETMSRMRFVRRRHEERIARDADASFPVIAHVLPEFDDAPPAERVS